MRAWCERYDLPLTAAEFEHQGAIMKPTDSLSAYGRGMLQPTPGHHNTFKQFKASGHAADPRKSIFLSNFIEKS